jgi:hypothetical protein
MDDRIHIKKLHATKVLKVAKCHSQKYLITFRFHRNPYSTWSLPFDAMRPTRRPYISIEGMRH